MLFLSTIQTVSMFLFSVFVKLLKTLLRKTQAGSQILEEYQQKGCLTDKQRRFVVNTAVANMMEVHGYVVEYILMCTELTMERKF